MKVQRLPEWGEIEGYIGFKNQGIEVTAEKTGIKIKFAEKIMEQWFASLFAKIDVRNDRVEFTKYGLVEALEILGENSQTNEGESNES